MKFLKPELEFEANGPMNQIKALEVQIFQLQSELEDVKAERDMYKSLCEKAASMQRPAETSETQSAAN